MHSFYQYLQTLRGGHYAKEVEQFIDGANNDSLFPKHSDNYHQISRYLEDNAFYLNSMDIFDHLWEEYLQHK